MPLVLSGTTGIQFPDSSLQAAAASPYVLKNRIINGAMVIDQRNAGASTTPSATATNVYTLDRWAYFQSVASKFAVQQNAGSVTSPVGFSNYLGLTSQSSYSVVSTDYFGVMQVIEGFNASDLGWGTGNAKTVTLSFQVYSSLTGTFGGAIQNAAQSRSYPFTYSISTANTWTSISVTVNGDTSGTWVGSSNSGSVRVNFGLGMGSSFSGTAGAWAAANYISATGATSVVGTNGATFYITGVQLEVGSTATPFERRLYGQELINCQRYCAKIANSGSNTAERFGTAYYESTTGGYALIQLPVTMRSQPTLTTSAANTFMTVATSGNRALTSIGTDQASNNLYSLNCGVASGGVAGQPFQLASNSVTTASIIFSAEL